jgi:uncharacterized protein YjbJ (UPF0337 family)
MSDNTNTNTTISDSSASSMMNSAAGAVREGVAKVTGNPYDAAAAEHKKRISHLKNKLTWLDQAQTEWDASHAAAKIGPATVTTSGAHIDNQDRREGQWKETVGSAKESIGSLVGSKDLQQEGRNQSNEGQAQSAAGQATEWIQGSVDRLRGG